MFGTQRLKSVLAGCGIVAAAGLVPAAVAADEAFTNELPLILAQADQIDDATIEAFAAAQARIAELQSLYAAQYEAAETDEQRLQISEEATLEMLAVVEATSGITLDEYNAVVEAANEDPALVERINEAIAEAES